MFDNNNNNGNFPPPMVGAPSSGFAYTKPQQVGTVGSGFDFAQNPEDLDGEETPAVNLGGPGLNTGAATLMKGVSNFGSGLYNSQNKSQNFETIFGHSHLSPGPTVSEPQKMRQPNLMMSDRQAKKNVQPAEPQVESFLQFIFITMGKK